MAGGSGDPQLHTHAVVWSKVQDPSGKWLALDARFLLQQQYTLSWLYDAALRAELTARLDVAWERLEPGRGQAELAGVLAGLWELFSQRAEQVDAKLAELVRRWSVENDGADPDRETLYELGRRAALCSRPANNTGGMAPESQREEWTHRALDAGYDPVELAAAEPPARMPPRIDRDAVVAMALQRLTAAQSTWLRGDIAREMAALVPVGGAGSGAELLKLVDDLTDAAAARCVELHPASVSGTPCRVDGRPVSEHVTARALTAPAVLEQEARLLEWADTAIDPAPDMRGAMLTSVSTAVRRVVPAHCRHFKPSHS